MPSNSFFQNNRHYQGTFHCVFWRRYSQFAVSTAGEKDFDINYYSTNEGIISSGSEVFKNSVLNYIDEDVYVKICKLKTKKGITYKVSPILVNEETGEVE